jgi:hypothetical protein
VLIVGSNVMVKDPITGSTGAPKPKPLAVKLMVSVIVAALAVFVASALSATAQIAANKAQDFMAAVSPLSMRSHLRRAYARQLAANPSARSLSGRMTVGM